MSGDKNVELVFKAAGSNTYVKVDAEAVAEIVQRAFCKGDLEFIRVDEVKEFGSGSAAY